MVFSSNIFIYLFLPMCIISYFFVKWLFKDKDYKIRNMILIVFSLLFYLFGSGRYFIVLAAVVCISYFSGLLISSRSTHAKLIGSIAIIMDVLILFTDMGYRFGKGINIGRI